MCNLAFSCSTKHLFEIIRNEYVFPCQGDICGQVSQAFRKCAFSGLSVSFMIFAFGFAINRTHYER